MSFGAQQGPFEGRDTCESLSGFYFVLGTTWASWSRDTCESLSGFYFVLVTTWDSWSRDTCEGLSGFCIVLGTTRASWSRDTCESLSGFYFVLGTALAYPGGRKQFVLVRFCVLGQIPYSRGPPPVCLVFMLPMGGCRSRVSVIIF